MTTYNYPNMCWLRRSILMALLNHPYVKEAEVYYHVGTMPTEKVFIKTGRLFGGVELVQPGLTLSVHPYHTNFNLTKGVPPAILSSTTTKYFTGEKGGVTIGANTSNDITYKSCIKLMVQLYYTDGSYNTDLDLNGEFIDQRSLTDNVEFGKTFQYSDLLPEGMRKLADSTSKQVDSGVTRVQILPGEEILTQWLDILKYAIRDLRVLLPYEDVRNISLVHSDYPSSTWTASTSSLVFHTAYHIIELDLFEYSPPPRFIFPPIQELNLRVT